MSELGSNTDIAPNAVDDTPDRRIRDAARQLSIILVRRGINCNLITSNGVSVSTVLRLSMSDKILSIYWRSAPEKLGCELIFLKSIVKGIVYDHDIRRTMDPSRSLGLKFNDIKIQLETTDVETCDALHLCLETLLMETQLAEKEKNHAHFMKSLREAAYQVSVKQELYYQQLVHLKAKEGALILDKLLDKCYFSVIKYGFDVWTEFVRSENEEKMIQDKSRSLFCTNMH